MVYIYTYISLHLQGTPTHLLTTVSDLTACLPSVGVAAALSFTFGLILVPSMLGANRLSLAWRVYTSLKNK